VPFKPSEPPKLTNQQMFGMNKKVQTTNNLTNLIKLTDNQMEFTDQYAYGGINSIKRGVRSNFDSEGFNNQ